jgi:hypothetical protein
MSNHSSSNLRIGIGRRINKFDRMRTTPTINFNILEDSARALQNAAQVKRNRCRAALLHTIATRFNISSDGQGLLCYPGRWQKGHG